MSGATVKAFIQQINSSWHLIIKALFDNQMEKKVGTRAIGVFDKLPKLPKHSNLKSRDESVVCPRFPCLTGEAISKTAAMKEALLSSDHFLLADSWLV